MRTVQTKTTQNIGNNQQKVVTKTVTYMKVGDLIGTAKTAYDLGKTLRRKKGTIAKTLKQYGVGYIQNLITPLIALVTGMDAYKKVMTILEKVTPIAKIIARASGILRSWGNAGDIAAIILSTVSKIIVQLATIFLLKMKEMIWNFEFKIREISDQYIIDQISMATRDTVDKCNKTVTKDMKDAPDNIDKTTQKDEGNVEDGNERNDASIVMSPGGTNILYSEINEGIKIFLNGDWRSTNITDGSFMPCKKPWNGILFAFSYEGRNADSKQYGVLYSLDDGSTWYPLKPNDSNYYVYDAAIFGNNINFSQYTDVLKLRTDEEGSDQEEKLEYDIISVLENTTGPKKVYIPKSGEVKYYIIGENNELQEASKYTISSRTSFIIKPQRIISCTLSYQNDIFEIGTFDDEKTSDNQLVADLMEHDIKYFGDTSCIDITVFIFESSIEVQNDISANLGLLNMIDVSEDIIGVEASVYNSSADIYSGGHLITTP